MSAVKWKMIGKKLLLEDKTYILKSKSKLTFDCQSCDLYDGYKMCRLAKLDMYYGQCGKSGHYFKQIPNELKGINKLL